MAALPPPRAPRRRPGLAPRRPAAPRQQAPKAQAGQAGQAGQAQGRSRDCDRRARPCGGGFPSFPFFGGRGGPFAFGGFGGPFGGGCGGGGRRWGPPSGGDCNKFLCQKAKWFFRVLRDSDLEPLAAALTAAGGAAAEARAPLLSMAAVVRDDKSVRVLCRMKRSPAVQKLLAKLKALHERALGGGLSPCEFPRAVLNSDEWAMAIAQLRDALPAAAKAIEQLAALLPRLAAEGPLLLPRLLPVMIAMSMAAKKSGGCGGGGCGKTKGGCGGGGKKAGAGAGAAEPGNKAKKNISAEFVKDKTVPDGTVVAPGATFTKTWAVKNSGAAAWPKHTSLLHVGGDMELRPSAPRVSVGPVASGQEVQLSVELTAPPTAGRYWSYWRLVSGSGPASDRFKLRLWADVTVKAASEEKKTAEASASKKNAEASAPPPPPPPAAKEAPPSSAAAFEHWEELDLPALPAVAAGKNATAVASGAWLDEARATLDEPSAPRAQDEEKPVAAAAAAAAAAEEEEDMYEGNIQEETGGSDGILDAALEKALSKSDAKDEEEEGDAAGPAAPDNANWKEAVAMLQAMGFGKDQFQELLRRHKGNLQSILNELLRAQ